MKILSNAAWQLISETLTWQRAELQRQRERADRLIEALGRKHDLKVVMPQSDPKDFVHEVQASTGWFDNKPFPNPPRKDQQK